jgi:tetratricopeptide (TPR) repeat protein
MNEKNPTFTTHLRPSRCVGLLADSESSLDERERTHLEECPRCREYLSRLLGAVAARPMFELPLKAADEAATAEHLLAKVERLREHADFPGAFRLLTSVLLMDGRPEIRQQCALASARLHREMGYFEIAVEQFRSLLRSPDLGVAAKIDCLNNLAWFERQNQNLAAAAALLRDAARLGRSGTALAVRKEYAETLHQQAVVMMTREDYDTAAELIAEAVRAREEIDGEEQLDLARSLLVQGAIRSKQDDPAGGIELLSAAYELRVKALGPNHADVADLLCRMGDMYTIQGLHDEAKNSYDEAIVSFKNSASNLLGTIGLARCHARLREWYPDLDLPDVAQDFATRAQTVLARPLPGM